MSNICYYIILSLLIVLIIIICISLFRCESYKKSDIYKNIQQIEKYSGNIKQKLDGIDMIYISLDNDKDSKYIDNLKLQYRLENIDNYKIFNKFNSSNVHTKESDHIIYDHYGQNIKINTTKLTENIKETLSYLLILHDAQLNNYKNILIFNNDIYLGLLKTWNSNFNDLIKEAPENWKYINLIKDNISIFDKGKNFEKIDSRSNRTDAILINNSTINNMLNIIDDSNTYVINYNQLSDSEKNHNFESILKKLYKNESYVYKNTLFLSNTQYSDKDKYLLNSVNKSLENYINQNKVNKLIDHIVYINLDKRTDRKKQTENALSIFDVPVTRISGVVNDFGGLGCTQAHIKALQHAIDNKFSSVLICEDDIKFRYKKNKVIKYLSNLYQTIEDNNIDWDVILLSGGQVHSTPYNKYINKLQSAQTRTAYLVNAKYYDTLMTNFKEDEYELSTRGPSSYKGTVHDQINGHGFAGDQYWKRIQPIHNWFICKQKLCMQRGSYSDIQKSYKLYKDTYVMTNMPKIN